MKQNLDVQIISRTFRNLKTQISKKINLVLEVIDANKKDCFSKQSFFIFTAIIFRNRPALLQYHLHQKDWKHRYAAIFLLLHPSRIIRSVCVFHPAEA